MVTTIFRAITPVVGVLDSNPQIVVLFTSIILIRVNGGGFGGPPGSDGNHHMRFNPNAQIRKPTQKLYNGNLWLQRSSASVLDESSRTSLNEPYYLILHLPHSKRDQCEYISEAFERMR